MTDKPKGKQGFASMSPEKRKEIAQAGGLEASRLGTAHRWNRKTAREAGLKGVEARAQIKKASA